MYPKINYFTKQNTFTFTPKLNAAGFTKGEQYQKKSLTPIYLPLGGLTPANALSGSSTVGNMAANRPNLCIAKLLYNKPGIDHIGQAWSPLPPPPGLVKVQWEMAAFFNLPFTFQFSHHLQISKDFPLHTVKLHLSKPYTTFRLN